MQPARFRPVKTTPALTSPAAAPGRKEEQRQKKLTGSRPKFREERERKRWAEREREAK